MGIFDGLLAKMEGAVTSAEQRVAGLVHTADVAESKVTPWIGPLQPGVSRPAAVSLTLASTSAPASPSYFNIVEGMLGLNPPATAASTAAPSLFSSLTSALGFGGSTPAPAAPADVTGWVQDLGRWANILDSLDKNMNMRDGAGDLSQAVSSWKNSVFQPLQNKLSAALTSGGDASGLSAAHDDAVSRAKDLQRAIQDRWAQFSAQGVPTVADYVKAPYTAASETGAAALTSARKAAKSIESAAAGALPDVKSIAQYALWAVGGVLILYGMSMMPKGERR